MNATNPPAHPATSAAASIFRWRAAPDLRLVLVERYRAAPSWKLTAAVAAMAAGSVTAALHVALSSGLDVELTAVAAAVVSGLCARRLTLMWRTRRQRSVLR